MSQGRAAKRARKKQRRDARREAMLEVLRRRRRQRRFLLLGTSLVLVGVGAALALVAFRGPDEVVDEVPAEEAIPQVTPPVNEPVACEGSVPPIAREPKQLYDEPSDQSLDPERSYLLRLETSCGTIDVALDVENSPATTNSVVFLAREGFYDGLVFHRIIQGFMAQGGDPFGTGMGDPGYEVVEPPAEDFRYDRGVMAMAKSPAAAPGTSGSQFFIVTGDGAGHLPPEYAVVGEVVDGQDVLETIGEHSGEPPEEWVYIERATVIEQDDGAGS